MSDERLDVVERLRISDYHLTREAADEIEALREIVRRGAVSVEPDASGHMGWRAGGHPLLCGAGYALTGLTTDQAERYGPVIDRAMEAPPNYPASSVRR